MNEIIKSLISQYEGWSYLSVEDSGEGKLYGVSVDYIDTREMTPQEYEEWGELLDSVDIIHDTFQIYCSYDKSGFDFFDRREESNNTYIDIWLSDSFTESDLFALTIELDNICKRIDDLSFCKKFISTMTTKEKNEKEFTDFTPQQTAYLDVYKIHKELQFVTEKLAIMEMPCSVVDTLTIAINHIENARDILFKVMNGEGDPYTD